MWLLLKICIVLTAILFIAQAAFLDEAKQTYHDPIAPYLDIMPGQSTDLLKDFCQLNAGVKTGVEMGYCDFEAGDEIFGRVTVVESDHRITQLTLMVQPNRLTLGNLLLCWGKPIHVTQEYPETGSGYNLFWDNEFTAHIAATYYRKMDYYLPITYLSIKHEQTSILSERLPCGSWE
ncbi:MAG: hypothetical protein ABI700_17110 [Chloroflexota bacterium]